MEGYSKLVADVYIQTTMHFHQGSNNQQMYGRIDQGKLTLLFNSDSKGEKKSMYGDTIKCYPIKLSF